MELEQLSMLQNNRRTRAVLLVLDGLGGLPESTGGMTELETAATPHLDDLARQGVTGLHVPVAPGLTPGSGPAHLGLFGYDPVRYQVGRGVLSALGIGYDLSADHVAARGNFCTVDEHGRVTDRRAGRIPSDVGKKLCDKLNGIEIDGVTCDVRPVQEYRFLLVLRGRDDLNGDIADTDPQATEKKPLTPKARSGAAEKTAEIVGKFVDDNQRAHQISEGIFHLVVAILMVASGATAIKAFSSNELSLGLLETALSAVKSDELRSYVTSLIGG